MLRCRHRKHSAKGRSTAPLPPPPPPSGPNSADGIAFWTGLDYINGRHPPHPDNWPAVTDARLDYFKSMGFDSIILSMAWATHSFGGSRFVPRALTAAERTQDVFMQQRNEEDYHGIARAKAKGFKIYFAIYTANYTQGTQLLPWFDDVLWATYLSELTERCAAVKYFGGSGLMFDCENYTTSSGVRPQWGWNSQGQNQGHTEAETYVKVKERGAQMANAMANGFGRNPPPQTGAYFFLLPGGMRAEGLSNAAGVYNDPYGTSGINSGMAVGPQKDLLCGMMSVPGNLESFTIGDASFYKDTADFGYTVPNTPNISLEVETPWAAAMQWGTARTYDWASRYPAFSGGDPAKLHYAMFTWVDTELTPGWGGTARTPALHAAQMSASRKWSTGREFWNYSYYGFGTISPVFNYDPYIAGTQAASVAGVVDQNPPTISVSGQSLSGNILTVTGIANDDYALRSIKYTTSAGQTGYAEIVWIKISGNHTEGWVDRWDWTARVPLVLGPQNITFTATDIHFLTNTTTISATL